MTRISPGARGNLAIAGLCVLAAGTLAIGQLPLFGSAAALFWIGAFMLMSGALVLGLLRWHKSNSKNH
jgi:uncharacterized membrane protein HdeD (DUF308 family)